MKYCKDLPTDLRNLILKKDIDVVGISESFKLVNHRWCIVPTDTIVTPEGYEWFNKINIPLSKYVAIFKCDKNFVGYIHNDAPPQKLGFNFVMSGVGEMQWVEFDGQSEKTVWDGGGMVSDPYDIFGNVSNIRVLESWTGTDGLVKVDIPHRVVGGPEDRYAISIRPSDKCNYTFDDVVQILGL